jgi:acyl-CoA thioester hydrolase
MQFTWPVRVYYEDTDAGGVVYHSQYLNYLERTRTEWLRNLGYEQTKMREEYGIVFVVRHIQIDFIKPARFDDALMVSATIAGKSGVSLKFNQTIMRDSELLIQAKVDVVCVDVNKFKPTRIPQQMLKHLESIPLIDTIKSLE